MGEYNSSPLSNLARKNLGFIFKTLIPQMTTQMTQNFAESMAQMYIL